MNPLRHSTLPHRPCNCAPPSDHQSHMCRRLPNAKCLFGGEVKELFSAFYGGLKIFLFFTRARRLCFIYGVPAPQHPPLSLTRPPPLIRPPPPPRPPPAATATPPPPPTA